MYDLLRNLGFEIDFSIRHDEKSIHPSSGMIGIFSR